ncbi:MAG: sulfur carrier protein ThiS [Verrucomicrobiota bacterium]
MTLQINGESREIPGVKTIPDLVSALGLPPSTVLVEHNGLALHRSEWASTSLDDGDRIEILQVAAGG